MPSVISLLEKTAGIDPDRTLYTLRGVSGDIIDKCTFGEFHRRTNGLARELCDNHLVGSGEPVLLVYQPGLDFAAAFFACVKAGSIPVPVPPPGRTGAGENLERLEHIARDCGARTVLSESRLLDRLEKARERDNAAGERLRRSILGSLSWIDTADLATSGDHFDATPGTVLFLQYTSGSTENPRGVMVTHDNVIHNTGLVLETIPGRLPVGVSWLPHYHDMGLVGFYLFAVTTGGTSHLLSPLDFLRRPLLWLETIMREQATITSAPNFGLEYCLRDDKIPTCDLEGLDLGSLGILLNGAEPVRHSTVERFMAKFGACGLKPGTIQAGYGLAEHTLCVTRGVPTTIEVDLWDLEHGRARLIDTVSSGRQRHKVVSCGRPPPGVAVKIVDPQNSTGISDHGVGEIWVTSPSKAAGYWNNPKLSRETFEARQSDSTGPETYLRTGDMGFLHDDELYVCGRRKDMIVVRGQNIYATDIEALIERHFEEVTPGSVVAFGSGSPGDGDENLIVLLEGLQDADETLLHAVQREIRKCAKTYAKTLAVVPKGTILRTSSGKIIRHQCRARWAADEIQPVVSITATPDVAAPGDNERVIDEILSRLDGVADPDQSIEAAGLDSLDLVTLNLYLEERLSQIVPDPDGLLKAFSDLRLLQAMKIRDLSGVVMQLRGPETDRSAIERLTARIGDAILVDEKAAMFRDTALPHWNGTSRHLPPPGKSAALITGASGFLGSYLLRSLLELAESPVLALIRCSSVHEGRERLAKALVETGLSAERSKSLIEARVSVLQGDLAETRLGLSNAEWENLIRDVGDIYHCGAEVDYVRPYGSLRSANVAGTRSLLELAAGRSDSTFHYISTTFIFGWTILDRLKETARNRNMTGIDFGYAQTKWVAEQLIVKAIRRGLRAKIYRPSLITASRDAHFVSRDITSRILGYMIRHGISVDLENQVSFVPVDVCANNIVAISLLDNVQLDTFHITDDEHYTLGDICSAITDSHGYRFTTIDTDAFLDHIRDNCREDDDLYPLRGFVNRNLPKIEPMKKKRYDNRNYRRARSLSANALDHPPLDRTVGAIVDFLQHEQLV